MNNNTIISRLLALRQTMKQQGISAYIIFGSDPHGSEYISDYWKLRQWMSGFDGSAGTLVVSSENAALWTDSRYYLQAAEQLKDTTISLMKQGLSETPDITEWILSQVREGDTVSFDYQMISANNFSKILSTLTAHHLKVKDFDLITDIYTNRPALPSQSFFVFDTKYSGKSTTEKIDDLRTEMVKQKTELLILSALDEIAWLFNIRGTDVPYNPVVIAYAMVSHEEVTLYIETAKLTEETIAYFKQQQIQLRPYLTIYQDIKNIPTKQKLWVDGEKVNQALFQGIPNTCDIKNGLSPVYEMKSIKNDIEISGIRTAMVEDGIAMVRFFKWLYENIASGTLSELSISEKLSALRAKQNKAMGDSFNTVAGYAQHGAIVHYSANADSNLTLKENGLLLLDSGGHYLYGTTDITRTITLGKPTTEQTRDFTLVLKGHIALATATFPKGTCGAQIDILARKALWDEGLNYGHGTGHGVGHFLNVHEGPQSIRMDSNPIALKPGMIISNEPGIYRTGEYGIRIENLVHVIKGQYTEFGEFLQFETLTLFPIDQRLIDLDLLNETEINWLNNYHSKVNQTLAPFLDAQEKKWLEKACCEIFKLPS